MQAGERQSASLSIELTKSSSFLGLQTFGGPRNEDDIASDNSFLEEKLFHLFAVNKVCSSLSVNGRTSACKFLRAVFQSVRLRNILQDITCYKLHLPSFLLSHFLPSQTNALWIWHPHPIRTRREDDAYGCFDAELRSPFFANDSNKARTKSLIAMCTVWAVKMWSFVRMMGEISKSYGRV